MFKIPTTTVLALVIGLIGGAGGTYKPAGDRATTPDMAAANPSLYRGKTMEWGGLLVSSRNMQDRTELEILSLPLNQNGRPDREGRPGGRFLARRPGYIETVDYTPGSLVTITGRLIGFQDGRVGGKTYRYPEILIKDYRFFRTPYYPTRPDVRVGVGVGSWGSGVSVGIGF